VRTWRERGPEKVSEEGKKEKHIKRRWKEWREGVRGYYLCLPRTQWACDNTMKIRSDVHPKLGGGGEESVSCVHPKFGKEKRSG
jgi:hypothetical protein